jgi:hypothetical protein
MNKLPSKIPRIMLVAVLLLPALLRAQPAGVPSSSLPRYLVLDETDIAVTKRKLAQIADGRYHILAVAPLITQSFLTRLTILLERDADAEPHREYVLLDDQASGLTRRVNEKAEKGYRVVHRGAFEKRNHDWGRDFRHTFWQRLWGGTHTMDQVDHTQFDSYLNYVLMETHPESIVSCHYTLIAPNETRFVSNITPESHARVVSAESFPWVLEICGNPPGVESLAGEIPPLRSLLRTGKAERDQKELDAAVSEGFSIVHVAGQHLTLEKIAILGLKPNYRIISESNESLLEKRLSSASASGFRALPESLYVKATSWTTSLSVVAETVALPSYEYKILQRNDAKSIQETLNASALGGYGLNSFTRDRSAITIVMEKLRP